MKIRNFKHLDILTALFVTTLLLSNIASSKLVSIRALTFDAGLILFPLAYILGDVLTEVYGYSRTRRVIWIGFTMSVLMVATFYIVAALPAAADWHNQDAFAKILTAVPRIVVASIFAYLVGTFVNSYILAKLKLKQKGEHFWFRALASTTLAQIFDTTIFLFIAFWGTIPTSVFLTLWYTNYIIKVLVEIIVLPVTYHLVQWLKVDEAIDFFDKKTQFNPFKLK